MSLAARLDRLESTEASRVDIAELCRLLGFGDEAATQAKTDALLIPRGASLLEAARIIGGIYELDPGDVIAEARHLLAQLEVVS
jgi:hypothetical protein